MQTSTARGAAMAPPQCPTTEAPGPYFQKEFFHNGYIKSLKQLVHFYNTRDVYAYQVTSGQCPAGTTEKVDCWPIPEVPNNIDMTTGNLGLTDQEENQIVAFSQTLTDGFTTPYPNSDTFTGACKTGGSASTQGHEVLIPTPDPLPPCAAAVCGVAPLPGPNLSRRAKARLAQMSRARHGWGRGRRSHRPWTGHRMRFVPSEALRPAIATAVDCMLFSSTTLAQILPPAQKATHVEITLEPTPEMAVDDLAIIRWTTTDPGGDDQHFGIVRYGLDPRELSHTAKSPIRLNRGHPEMIFRVLVEGLKPQTTYYYAVTSTESNGESDRVESSVYRFTTPRRGQRIVGRPAEATPSPRPH